MKNYLSTIICIALIAGAASFFFVTRERTAYIINQEVFDAFEGKKELEAKLGLLRKQHKDWLDSVNQIIQNNPERPLIERFQETASNFEEQEQQLSQKYTTDIWKKINTYLVDYGKENKYDFIHGATGNGSLMYADDANNITKEVIQYINERYKKGD